MAEIEINYKGSTIASMNASGTKTLETAGTYCEGDIEVVYTRPSGGGGSVTVVTTQDEHGGDIVTITGEVVNLQSKTGITPTTSSQTITADSGYTGLSSVQINAIPSQYIVPTGTKSITQNGTGIDVSAYASANVNVQPSLQSKTNITPTESSQTITADSGYDGLSSVQINAISSTYVGSGITQRSSSDLTASGATVTVPAGYYASQASKSVSSGTEGTPTATKGTVSNNSISVTPSVTNTAGYISGSTKTGTAVTVSASELVSGTKTISASGMTDVTNYASASVAAGTATAPSSISGSSATVSTGTNTITLTKTVSVTPNVSTAGYISSGTAGNSSVSLTASVTTKSAATITPTKSEQTIASGTYLTGTQTIAAIPAAYQDVTGVTASAGDVVSGKSIVDSTGATVNGSLVIQHYYTGSGTPSSSTGANGDIYLKTS